MLCKERRNKVATWLLIHEKSPLLSSLLSGILISASINILTSFLYLPTSDIISIAPFSFMSFLFFFFAGALSIFIAWKIEEIIKEAHRVDKTENKDEKYYQSFMSEEKDIWKMSMQLTFYIILAVIFALLGFLIIVVWMIHQYLLIFII
jgi:hypothetical protein